MCKILCYLFVAMYARRQKSPGQFNKLWCWNVLITCFEAKLFCFKSGVPYSFILKCAICRCLKQFLKENFAQQAWPNWNSNEGITLKVFSFSCAILIRFVCYRKIGLSLLIFLFICPLPSPTCKEIISEVLCMLLITEISRWYSQKHVLNS